MMPRRIELWNQHMKVELGKELDLQASQLADEQVLRDTWTIVFTDRQSGDEHRITVSRDGRDGLVRELTGGVVLAGGEFPRI